MSVQSSRPTTPASSIKGLGPFRTPRSRPGQQLSQSRFGSIISHDSRPVSRVSSRFRHRRTSSLPSEVNTPYTQGTHFDRHQREITTTSRASSPPVSGSHLTRAAHSLQTLARSGSFSRPKTPKGRRSTETPNLTEDEGDHSDGSRFDLLPSDPFRSDSPIALLDTEEAPPLPPKPLHIIPPSQLIIPNDPVQPQTPVSEGSRTPTSATVAAMKSALNRMTMSGRPRLRLLSFIKEAKSPISAVEPEPEPPKLQLPNFQAEPLFDVSAFQLQDIPVNRRSMRVQGHTLGHAAPPQKKVPPLAIPPPPPNPPTLGTLPGASALQLDLNGDGDFEGYIIEEESPIEAHEQAPPKEPEVVQPKSPDEVPNWIAKFREELEELAGEALSITRFSDKLVLELPKEPGLSHRRTLIFQDTDLEESTPELTSDTISVSSHGRPPRPTRPPPPIPQEYAPEEPSGVCGVSDLADEGWNPHLYNEASPSLLSIHSGNSGYSFDPNQPIPSIPDFDSSYLSSDDEHTIRSGRASPPLPVFQPSLSKQDLIEEAIRKIQRQTEGSRLLVIEEQDDETDLESEASEEPVIERGPTLIRHISNPFGSIPSPEPSVCT